MKIEEAVSYYKYIFPDDWSSTLEFGIVRITREFQEIQSELSASGPNFNEVLEIHYSQLWEEVHGWRELLCLYKSVVEIGHQFFPEELQVSKDSDLEERVGVQERVVILEKEFSSLPAIDIPLISLVTTEFDRKHEMEMAEFDRKHEMEMAEIDRKHEMEMAEIDRKHEMEMAKLESLASGVLGYDKSVWYFAILVGFIIILYLNTNSAEEDKSGVAIENEELTVELRSSEESVESVRERKTPNLRSHKSCHQLGNIGRDAYNTKVAGAPLFYITGIISKMLQHDPARRDAAIGTVIAVYGDASLNSGYQAYSAIYDACKQ